MRAVLVIVGPTGVGKTDVSIELATRWPAEIVSADSRQVYQYMDIGAAKPSQEQLAAAPHHFIDAKFPDEYYSAGQYATEARKCIDGIFERGKQPIVVGGSGLYIRALVDGLFEPKIADQKIKQRLKKQTEESGVPAMHNRLRQVDPRTADSLHATDSQRILRALEVFEITGRPFSEFLEMKTQPADFEPRFVGLTLERRQLYQRIERRVDQMLEDGLLDEVKQLEKRGYSPELNALQTVGYKEAFLYLRGELEYSEMVGEIKQKSRNYAKRQLTWFRRDERVRWLDLGAFRNTAEVANEVQRLFEEGQPAAANLS